MPKDINRLKQQMDFIIEIDKLKAVFRQSYLADGTRKENDPEHSWHLAMMAIILSEYANVEVDVLTVVKMVLIHDIVEIDAGDTYAYDEKGHELKLLKEREAAKRIFGLLPKEQGQEYERLWETFEQKQTPEAKFAAAIDRVQPILLNYLSKGKAWLEHGIYKEQVIAYNKHAAEGSLSIWEYIKNIIDEAYAEGYLR